MIFIMQKCCCVFALLILGTLNIYGMNVPKDYIFMKKLQQNSSPQRYLYNEIAIEQIDPNPDIDGGISQEDPNDIKYYELAKESLQKYQQDTGAKQHHVLKVTKASEQVVAGFLTRIDFYAAPITGELNELNAPTSSSNGVNVYDNNIITCHSEIWEQPWINSKIIEVNCWE